MQDIPSISKSVSGDILPIWNLRADWPILDLAVSSLALAVFSRVQQHAPAAIEASRNYDRLLQMLQVNILYLDAQNINACLLAIFHMSRYEEAIHKSGHPNLRTTFNKSLRSFSHHDGALAILKVWSQQLKRGQPATNVIKHTRRGLIRSALLRNLTVPEWMRDGAAFGEEGLELDYDGLIVRIVILRQQLSLLMKDETIAEHHHKFTFFAGRLSKEALNIDVALQDWMNHFPRAWYYERHNLPVPHPWPMRDFWSHIVHSYPSPPVAAIWNQYYATRMLINSTHLGILNLYHGDSYVLTSKQHLECLLNVKLMGDYLASTVPFCLQRFRLTKSSDSSSSENVIRLITEEDIKPFLATLLIWPLTIASTLRYVEIEQRTWFRSELAYLGKVLGVSVIEHAETDLWPEL